MRWMYILLVWTNTFSLMLILFHFFFIPFVFFVRFGFFSHILFSFRRFALTLIKYKSGLLLFIWFVSVYVFMCVSMCFFLFILFFSVHFVFVLFAVAALFVPRFYNWATSGFFFSLNCFISIYFSAIQCFSLYHLNTHTHTKSVCEWLNECSLLLLFFFGLFLHCALENKRSSKAVNIENATF